MGSTRKPRKIPAVYAYNPRFVTDRYHDEAADGFVATVAKIADRFDRVRVISRGGHLYFDSRNPTQSGENKRRRKGRDDPQR